MSGITLMLLHDSWQLWICFQNLTVPALSWIALGNKNCGLQAHWGRSSLHAGSNFWTLSGRGHSYLIFVTYPFFVFVVENDSAGYFSTVQDSLRTSLGSQWLSECKVIESLLISVSSDRSKDKDIECDLVTWWHIRLSLTNWDTMALVS